MVTIVVNLILWDSVKIAKNKGFELLPKVLLGNQIQVETDKVQYEFTKLFKISFRTSTVLYK
jgi:hypothetical protein